MTIIRVCRTLQRVIYEAKIRRLIFITVFEFVRVMDILSVLIFFSSYSNFIYVLMVINYVDWPAVPHPQVPSLLA